jgi:hypothetical protein
VTSILLILTLDYLPTGTVSFSKSIELHLGRVRIAAGGPLLLEPISGDSLKMMRCSGCDQDAEFVF